MYIIWKVFDKKPSGRDKKFWGNTKDGFEKVMVATRNGDVTPKQMDSEIANMRKSDTNSLYWEKLGQEKK